MAGVWELGVVGVNVIGALASSCVCSVSMRSVYHKHNTPKLVMAASIILVLPRKPPTRFTFQFPRERSVWTIASRDCPECL